MDETVYSRDRDYPGHMVPKLITMPLGQFPDEKKASKRVKSKTKVDNKHLVPPSQMPHKGISRMANYNYFAELYKQKMHH